MTANDGGAIDTTVTSSQPSAAGLAAGTFLNIHLAPAAQLGGPGSLGYTPISCADITPAASTAVTMAPPPQPGQQPQGSAKLTYDPAKKTLSVDATASGLVAGSAHAVHIHLGSCASQGAVKYRLGREVAAAIPGATFIPLQGSAHFPWHGDTDSVVRACREALAPVQPSPHHASEPESVLLSSREREILACVARGLGDREIAEQLVLSPHTVHRHVANIRRKLGRTSRTAAVAEAARLGLL